MLCKQNYAAVKNAFFLAVRSLNRSIPYLLLYVENFYSAYIRNTKSMRENGQHGVSYRHARLHFTLNRMQS